MNLIDYCNRIIRYTFYALFILVPLSFSQYTSELFELNKMWITFAATIIIASAWITKMISLKKFVFRRTFFDIPLLLFFLSQMIATFISLDPHISWWGYYSRFNGGFYSTICYIVLFYALVTNLAFKEAKKSLTISLATGLGVALWGLPAHFGKDPTCLLFRGTFDTTCWTEAFQPTVRIFSTLGQPAWLAAYLAFLIPLAIAYSLNNLISKEEKNYKQLAIYYSLCVLLFYLCLIFANTRAGFIAFWAGNTLFWVGIYIKGVLTKKDWVKFAFLLNGSFLLLNFIFGFPLSGFDKFTAKGLMSYAEKWVVAYAQESSPEDTTNTINPNTITDSGVIRQIVWKGAVDAWEKSPLFGTGVETFAFAYYGSRPSEHNLTSEWDFLYNKAHNEYLNYLTTTGAFGLGSYLIFIGATAYFFLIFLKDRSIQTQEQKKIFLLATGLFAGWTTILISNFFGFSVVIINIFFFLTPAYLLLIYTEIHPENKYLKSLPESKTTIPLTAFQITGLIFVVIIALYMLLKLLTYWNADKAYALGYNLNRVGDYQNAYTKLTEAVTLRPGESVFKDELALNLATIATALSLQEGADQTTASQAAQQAIALSNEVTTSHPNNIAFWKNRVKIFLLLTQSNIEGKEVFQQLAIDALQKVLSLAPTDAKVMYNLGSLLKEKDPHKAVEVLTQTIEQKPNYTDAYRELALTYKDLAEKSQGTSRSDFVQKSKENFEKVLELNPDDKKSQDELKNLNI
jgi:putative inorganic carbon (hco3(-)) transporter